MLGPGPCTAQGRPSPRPYPKFHNPYPYPNQIRRGAKPGYCCGIRPRGTHLLDPARWAIAGHVNGGVSVPGPSRCLTPAQAVTGARNHQIHTFELRCRIIRPKVRPGQPEGNCLPLWLVLAKTRFSRRPQNLPEGAPRPGISPNDSVPETLAPCATAPQTRKCWSSLTRKCPRGPEPQTKPTSGAETIGWDVRMINLQSRLRPGHTPPDPHRGQGTCDAGG